MGYIRHSAIILTGWKDEHIAAAKDKAEIIGLQVIGPSKEVTNGYKTICVVPDGSKEGWPESNQGDERRREFTDWLNASFDIYLEWVEVDYGDDDSEATIKRTPWQEPKT